MKFNLSAISRLKEIGITSENLGEALQDVEKASQVVRIGLEEAGDTETDPKKFTLGEVMEAWFRDMGGETVKKLRQQE